MTGTLAKSAIAAAFAAAIGFALLSPAGAASDVQITRIGCSPTYHPPVIAIENRGDTAQNLIGWRLQSEDPTKQSEVFLLDVVDSLGPGKTIFVFNGHGYDPQPGDEANGWYAWNPGSFDYAIVENGTDYLRLVDATQFPWREVDSEGCPGTTEIPPFQQPATPTPAPSGGNTGGDTNQPPGNQSDNTQTEGNQQAAASQNDPAANTAARSAGSTAQTGNVSGQLAGGPSSGIGVLSPASGGPPLAGHPLALSFLGVVAGAALMLVGMRMMRRARRRTNS